MSNTTSNKGIHFFVGFAALIIIVAGLKAASEIVVPFMLSMFIAILCTPFMAWLTKYRVPTWLAIVIVISLMVLSIASLGVFVGASLDNLYLELPNYRAKLTDDLEQVIGLLNRLGVSVSSETITSHFDPGILMQMVANTLSSLGGVLTNLFLVLMTVVFILFEATDFPKKLSIALEDASDSFDHFESFVSSVKRYLFIKTLVSIGTGMGIALWLWILNVDFPLLWGLVAFFLNFVPNIGSLIAAIPAVMLSFVQLGGLEAGLVAFGYFAINLIMGSIIEPRYMGKGLGLSTLVVFLSLLLWGWVFGVVGMLLSIPLTIIVKIGLEANPKTRWIALILGSSPAEEGINIKQLVKNIDKL